MAYPDMSNLTRNEYSFGALMNRPQQESVDSGSATALSPQSDYTDKIHPSMVNSLCFSSFCGFIPADRTMLMTGVSTIPGELVLRKNQSGFFFGGEGQAGKETYVGLPQGKDGHILIVGSTGSGKTTGLMMPTLQTWKGAIVATDVKGDLSQAYAKLLQEGKVSRPFIVFDPTDPDTVSYDIWKQLDTRPAEVSISINCICNVLVPSIPNERDPFWRNTARSILFALLFDSYERGLCFPEALARLMGKTVSELCQELSTRDSVEVREAIGEYNKMDAKMRAIFDREIRNIIHPIASNAILMHALRGERGGAGCFDWNDINGYNVFLRLPEDSIEAVGPILNLLYMQLFRSLQRRPEKYTPAGKKNTPVLLLMDEFAQCGKLPFLTGAMSTLRCRSVNICLSLQSFAQLDKIYGAIDRRTIADDCAYQIILGCYDADTQRSFADLIGTHLVEMPSRGVSINAYGTVTGFSAHLSTQREYIIQPHEFAHTNSVLLNSPYGFARLTKHTPVEDLSEDQPSLSTVASGLSAEEIQHYEGHVLSMGEWFTRAEKRLAEYEKKLYSSRNIGMCETVIEPPKKGTRRQHVDGQDNTITVEKENENYELLL